MTNKPSSKKKAASEIDQHNPVRFNKHASKSAPVPHRKKRSQSPYVSDLSKTPDITRSEAKGVKRVVKLLVIIFAIACVDALFPNIKQQVFNLETPKWEMNAPFESMNLQNYTAKVMVFLSPTKTESAILLEDTEAYHTPSSLHDPALLLSAGMSLDVIEYSQNWAKVRSSHFDEQVWVPRSTLLIN